ncbi:MAG TPA: NFACT RNA binding domain-containing protein, partial [Chroococcales cyanobacterium]
EEEDRLGAKKKRLAAEIAERIEKKEDLAHKLKEGLREADKSDTWRLWGELLNTYAREVPPFSQTALLPNYGGEIEKIPLEPALSATENSQKFFKKYRKAKMVREVNQRMLAEIAEEVAYLEGVLASIDFATEKGELEEIQTEIAPPKNAKNVKSVKNSRSSKKVKILESQPLHFLSRDGYEILVGKNNRQNDILTMKNAAPMDWWLHAQYIPGSHVIVKSQGEEILPTSTLIDAAGLAAYYSRARESTKVPVVCLRRRQVKKPPGSKPGLVIYTNEKVVLVAPWDGVNGDRRI